MTPSEHTVSIVPIALDAPHAPDGILDERERATARRFVFERDRVRYVAAHTATRLVLAHYLDMAPDAIRYEIGAYGKPRVANASVDVRFNLSHSGERGLIAIALRRELGVDIEHHRPVDILTLAERVFSAAERAALRAVGPERRLEAFYRVWTRKESFIKARGDGLNCPLDAFDVSLADDGAQLLGECRAGAADDRRWTVVNLPAGPGYSGALTVEGCGATIGFATGVLR